MIGTRVPRIWLTDLLEDTHTIFYSLSCSLYVFILEFSNFFYLSFSPFNVSNVCISLLFSLCTVPKYFFPYIFYTVSFPLFYIVLLFSSFLNIYFTSQPTSLTSPVSYYPQGTLTFLLSLRSYTWYVAFWVSYLSCLYCPNLLLSLFFPFMILPMFASFSFYLNNLKFSLHHETILSYRISLFFLSVKVNTHFSVFADMFNNSACMTIIVTKSEVYSFPDFSSARTQTFERIVQFSLESLPVIFVRAASFEKFSLFARDLGRSQAAGTCSRVRM